MATKRVFVVFVLPVIFSISFWFCAVMNDILQKPGRELNMWPMSHPLKEFLLMVTMLKLR